ncbi:MAG: ZTL protein [Gammaproteobacteria bacterium]|nr:ZTL protein [Gammaproteobacteria bacterium]
MIQVLAGVNGAGKSSIGGAAIRAAGEDWYNPDEFARVMCAQFPEKSMQQINSAVWHEGLRRLEGAIRDKSHFTFETTLGGNTITNTLLDAIAAGVPVNIWYCGLNSVELHIERVAMRVARGGHAIPEDLIRSRYVTSMRNLCRLTPGLSQLAVYDNSRALDDKEQPDIRRLFYVVGGEVRELDQNMPDWAKPVAAVSLRGLR